MSFVHISWVGHFDPNNLELLWTRPLPTPGRPIDEVAARALLATFGEEVERCVSFEGGCAYCEWSAGRIGVREGVREYADRLADQQGAIVLEFPPRHVRYPPVAVQSFVVAGRAWAERRHGTRFSGR
jgi:hypothetical protein